MNPRLSHYDVVIVGAGIAGTAAAQALSLADPDGRRNILLVDRYPGVHPRFSGEFIHPRGAQVLEDLGFHGPLVRAGAIEVDGFAVFENADKPWVDLAYAAITGERPRGLSVHHKVLVRVMRDVMREREPAAGKGGVELLEGWAVCELLRDPVGKFTGVVLEEGERRIEVTCDTIIAADGKGSTVRKLAGISDEGRETIGFTAGLELVNASLPRPVRTRSW